MASLRCLSYRISHSFVPPSRRLFHTSLPRLSDPYPIALQTHQPSPQNDSSSEGVPPEWMPKPLPRDGEPVGTLRARLVYQSRRRGTLESDLLLSTFAKENLATMPEKELKEFDMLMDEPDWDIYYWCTNKRQPPERWAHSPLLERLRVHVKNEDKVVRRMPDLSEGR